jgi:muramoyltetrapeptide carboxypeptidase
MFTMKLMIVLIILAAMLGNSIYASANSLPTILPSHLKPGDTVALISSGFRVPEDESIQFAAERVQALGLKVKYGKFVFGHSGYFSATDQERAEDLNAMFADPEVKAIFELRGGWGSNRILSYLDYDLIKKHPKILMGFSDITSLLLAIQAKTGLVTFHGPVSVQSWPAFTVNYLQRVLFAGEKVVFANPVLVDTQVDIIQVENRIHVITGGIAQGKLVGGNLTTIISMLSSEYLPNWQGAILFVEDVDEDYYKMDRMFAQLEMTGVLKQLSGFVFGQCVRCSAANSTSGIIGSATLGEILNHYIKPLKIPAWYGAMIGHSANVFTLPEGVQVQINADQGTIALLESPVKV